MASDSRPLVELLLLVLCLLLSAFFSGSEAAFLAVGRLRLRHLVEKGVPGARRVARLAEHPEKLLPTVLLGNNLVNTAAAALGTAVALAFLGGNEQLALILATVGITALLLVFGEVVPKTLAARHPERFALTVARPMEWFSLVLFPLAVVLQGLSRLVTRSSGWQPRALITEEELKTFISIGEESGAVERQEAEIMHKVFRLGDREASDVMTPRTEVVWVEQGTTLRQFLELYSQHPHNRYPVFAERVDRVVGVLYLQDIVATMARRPLGPDEDVTVLARPAFFTPETKPLDELFQEMRERGQHLAVVVDEFGGVAGIVTLHDIIEELVGAVTEEGEAPEERVVALGEDTYEVDGGMRVDELNEQLPFRLPEGDYDTIAGFLLQALGRIPREGEEVALNGFRLTVVKMDGVKIERVRLQRLASQQGGQVRPTE